MKNKNSVLFLTLLFSLTAEASKTTDVPVASGPNKGLLQCYVEVDASLANPREYLGIEITVEDMLLDVQKLQGEMSFAEFKESFELFLKDSKVKDSEIDAIIADVDALFAYSETKTDKVPELKSLKTFIKTQGGKSETAVVIPGSSNNHNLDELTVYLDNGNAYETGKVFDSLSNDENNPSIKSLLFNEKGISTPVYLNYAAFSNADLSSAEIDFTHNPDTDYPEADLTLANGADATAKLIKEITTNLDYHEDIYDTPHSPDALRKAINICLKRVEDAALREKLNEKLMSLPTAEKEKSAGASSVVDQKVHLLN